MPRWGVYISIDQLGYPRASIRDVVHLARTLHRDSALRILGTYNLALSLSTTKGRDQEGLAERHEAQQAMLRNSISVVRLRELQDKLGNEQLLNRPLFHRSQLLTMIKLAAKFGDTTGGNQFLARDDFDVIAELGLLVNSLWPTTINTETDLGDSLAPDLAVGLEIENPPPIAESMVRAHFMFQEHLRRVSIQSVFARRVERTFVFSTGLNFEELLDLTFAVWSYYFSLSVNDLIQDQRKGHFNPMLSGGVASGERLTQILDAYSTPFGEVPGLSFGPADRGNFLRNHTALRRSPLWKFGDDNYLCVDPAFLQEKLSSGVYWTVMNAFDSEDRDEFARVWGRLFELHLWKTLEAIFSSDRVWRSPRYDDENEAFDAVIDFGDRLVVCQAKASFIPIDVKYSGDATEFFQGMESRFGDEPGAALRQIRENLTRCFGLENRRPMSALKGRRFREVLPIVVYQEPILEFGLVTRRFAKRLDDWLARTLFQLDLHVRPVVFLHIDDFHMLAQYIRDGDISLIEALHDKLAADRDHIESFAAFWREKIRPRMNVETKGDRILAEDWKRYSESALERFRTGAYL